jgi:DNA-binding PadR family transcriptional regulator
MSVHQFDTEIAKEYGIESAVLLSNICFWIEKNKANEKHFYDGTYWTYNSIRAFSELFPYMSGSTIRRSLKRLESEGIIGTGNYNKVAYDRTIWYSITEKGFDLLNNSICHFDKIDLHKNENEFSQNVKPIPDIKPDDKTQIVNTDNKNEHEQDKKQETEMLQCNTIDRHVEEEKEEQEEEQKEKKKRTRKLKEEKMPFGTFQNVFLSKKEYSDLNDAYTENVLLAGIEAVSVYVQGHPEKHYSNFNRVMLNWGIDAGKSAIQSGKYSHSSSSPKEKEHCPVCGGEVIGGICIVCRNLVGLDGEV